MSQLVASRTRTCPPRSRSSPIGRAQDMHEVELDDVVVERQFDGKVKLHQPSLTGRGAAGGALWGGLIGLIFFMPLFGMAIGAARAPRRGR